jgi:N-methylhydantoinase A
LNTNSVEAAYGVYTVANSNIRRAITSVSSERGRDPRKFSLFVFGGAGALHGAAVARSIGMKEVIIAPLAGIFSAYGLLCADIQRNFVIAYDGLLGADALPRLNKAFQRMTTEALQSANEHRHPASAIHIVRYADLRYRRQQSELTIPLPSGDLEAKHVQSLTDDFHKEYELTFGFRLSHSPIEIVNLRVSSTITISKPATTGFEGARSVTPKKEATKRKAYFGVEHGLIATPVLDTAEVPTTAMKGPLLIDTYDSTIVVPPDCRIKRSLKGNLVITLL